MLDNMVVSLGYAQNFGKLGRISDQSNITLERLKLIIKGKEILTKKERKRLTKLEYEGLK